MNNANYKTEYERRDLRQSFIAEIIARVCIISFPRVLFSKLFSSGAISHKCDLHIFGAGTPVDYLLSGYSSN
jgi:hypothetical protein